MLQTEIGTESINLFHGEGFFLTTVDLQLSNKTSLFKERLMIFGFIS